MKPGTSKGKLEISRETLHFRPGEYWSCASHHKFARFPTGFESRCFAHARMFLLKPL